MFRSLVLFLALAILPASVSAQVLIVGGSAGQECYNAVRLNPVSSTRHERLCTDAIESGSLDFKNLAATRINRGIIRMRLSQYNAAMEDYARAEQMTPQSGALHLNKGAALIGLNKFEDAIASLTLALDLNTQDPYAAYYNLGIANEHLGRDSIAYHHYKTALDLRPEWSLPMRALERFTVTN